jgi:hypothetical protein
MTSGITSFGTGSRLNRHNVHGHAAANGLFAVSKRLLVLLPLILAACSDPSKGTVTALVKEYIAHEDAETWCLNALKVKSAKTNQPIGLMALKNLAQSRNLAQNNGRSTVATPADASPLIFAEEAFIKWNDHDAYIMAMLMGGKYIAVHEGGYAANPSDPGSPGGIYDPKDYGELDAIIDVIRDKGAVVDLTAKGRSDGVWDPENGFCVEGFWELKEVTGWTNPAADNEGKVVTHIKATETFHPTRLGAAKDAFNPMEIIFTTAEQEFVAAKFNDGWRLISGD